MYRSSTSRAASVDPVQVVDVELESGGARALHRRGRRRSSPGGGAVQCSDHRDLHGRARPLDQAQYWSGSRHRSPPGGRREPRQALRAASPGRRPAPPRAGSAPRRGIAGRRSPRRRRPAIPSRSAVSGPARHSGWAGQTQYVVSRFIRRSRSRRRGVTGLPHREPVAPWEAIPRSASAGRAPPGRADQLLRLGGSVRQGSVAELPACVLAERMRGGVSRGERVPPSAAHHRVVADERPSARGDGPVLLVHALRAARRPSRSVGDAMV